MSTDSLFAHPFGLVQLHSLGVSFPRWTREILNGPYQRHGHAQCIQYDEVEWQDMSTADRQVFLTDLHELDHFAMLISTPVGVLLWRMYQVITRDILYLARAYQEFGIEIPVKDCRSSAGVINWHRASGRTRLDLVSHKVPHGSVRINYIDQELIRGLESVVQLLDILTCEAPQRKHSNLTAGAFAALLNRVYDYLAIRCDVEVADEKWNGMWSSENPDSLVFEDPLSLNVLQTLELLAYCRERRTARQMRASDFDLEYWHNDRVPSSFSERLKSWLLAASDNETVLREVLIDSVLGRIDLATISPCPGWDPNGCGDPTLDRHYWELQNNVKRTNDGRIKLTVECEWPWWRSQRIRKHFHMRNPLTIRTILTLGSMSGHEKLYGPEARWESQFNHQRADATEASNPFEVHLNNVNEVFLSAIRAKFDSYNHLARGLGQTLQHVDLTKHLLLVEYEDEVDFYSSSDSHIINLFSASYCGFVTSLAYKVAVGESYPEPELVRSKLSAGIQRRLDGIQKPTRQTREMLEKLLENIQRVFSKESINQTLQMQLW